MWVAGFGQHGALVLEACYLSFLQPAGTWRKACKP